MGVEPEEEGGPAEEEDAARAMEPLDVGAAGSSRGGRPRPGDGGKGREGWEGRAPGAVVGARPLGPARAWGVRGTLPPAPARLGDPAYSCTHGEGCTCLLGGGQAFLTSRGGPLMLPAASRRRIGGPWRPFRRRDLASVQVGKDGPGSSKLAGVPR